MVEKNDPLAAVRVAVDKLLTDRPGTARANLGLLRTALDELVDDVDDLADEELVQQYTQMCTELDRLRALERRWLSRALSAKPSTRRFRRHRAEC
jgi:hypothetical protein